MSTGWEATHHLADVSEFFAQLQIPLPAVSAALAGYAELVCGALLVVGLASRLATVPLLICMIVALVTAKAVKVHGLRDLLMQVEFVYAILLVVLAMLGPGGVSLDAVVVRRLGSRNTRM
jgi:putative oxidoreductase